jgi:hypothetical protein
MFSVILAALQVNAQARDRPEWVGNCLSQTVYFNDTKRIFALDGINSNRFIDELDPGRYDYTIDYFTDQVSFPADKAGVQLRISDGGKPNPDAPRMSSTRYMQYGRVTTKFRAPAVHGVVATFVTMGPHLPDTGLERAPLGNI